MTIIGGSMAASAVMAGGVENVSVMKMASCRNVSMKARRNRLQPTMLA